MDPRTNTLTFNESLKGIISWPIPFYELSDMTCVRDAGYVVYNLTTDIYVDILVPTHHSWKPIIWVSTNGDLVQVC